MWCNFLRWKWPFLWSSEDLLSQFCMFADKQKDSCSNYVKTTSSSSTFHLFVKFWVDIVRQLVRREENERKQKKASHARSAKSNRCGKSKEKASVSKYLENPLCAFNQKSLDLSRILRLTSNCPPVPVHCASIDDKDSDHFHVKSY